MNIEQQQAEFEAWAASIGFCVTGKCAETSQVICSKEAFLAGYQVAFESLEVKALREALQEVVDAADGEGWDQLDPGMEKQRAALAAMEKQK